MALVVTNVQRLSMNRAEEGIKFLRVQLAALDTLEEMVSNLNGERACHDSFTAVVAERVKSLNETERNIFAMAPRKGAPEQVEKLKYAISRVAHCGKAVIYPERKKIIKSALAEAKDLIAKCIAFLEVEAHKFPEKGANVPNAELPATGVEPSNTRPRTKFSEVITIKLPLGFGTIDPIKLAQWIKERLQ